MGYISLKKSTGDVDLLPAENIVHVSMSDTHTAVIEYGVLLSDGGGGDTSLQATVVFVDSAAADKAWSSSVNARIAINNAISAAAGTSGPALPVALESGQFCGSVTIASA
jgi:hypothetical protein